jgi:hypothetical protein
MIEIEIIIMTGADGENSNRAIVLCDEIGPSGLAAKTSRNAVLAGRRLVAEGVDFFTWLGEHV